MKKHLKRLVSALDHRAYSPRARVVISVVMVATLVTATLISWGHLGLALTELRFGPLVLVLLTAPITFILSALEYRLLAKTLGVQRSWRESIEVSVIGYTSNLLPLPGGALVRVSSLTGRSGDSPKRPTQLTLILALLWLGTAVLFGGLGLVLLGRNLLGLCLLGGGVTLATGALVAARRSIPPSQFSVFALRAIGLEIAFVMLAVTRTFLAFRVIAIDAGFRESLVVASSNALSSTVGVVPAGLGVREGLAAMLAALVGIPAAAGFLASIVLRLTSLLVAVVGTVVLIPRRQVSVNPSNSAQS